MIKHNKQKRILVLLLVSLFFVSPYFLVFSPTKADTASVVGLISLPYGHGGRAQGLAWDGQYLWYSTTGGGRKGQGNRIYKVNPFTGKVVHSDQGGNPTGLAWDGQHLWNAHDGPNKIYRGFYSGRLGFDSPGNSPRGLAWDGHYLWNADVDDDRIYKLNPSTGEVVASFDSPGDSPRGLAWDGEYLWNVDSGVNKIFKLRVQKRSYAGLPPFVWIVLICAGSGIVLLVVLKKRGKVVLLNIERWFARWHRTRAERSPEIRFICLFQSIIAVGFGALGVTYFLFARSFETPEFSSILFIPLIPIFVVYIPFFVMYMMLSGNVPASVGPSLVIVAGAVYVILGVLGFIATYELWNFKQTTYADLSPFVWVVLMLAIPCGLGIVMVVILNKREKAKIRQH